MELQPSNHTKLANYLIGMCKKSESWITILADLGYNAEIIEQKINTSSGDTVKPDLVATSNRLVHSMVFECKGGIAIDVDQLRRYSSLTPENLLRWISVFDRANLQFDVCICDLAENHSYIKVVNQHFPMLTFSSEELIKERDFKREKLNEAFKEPISLKGKIPPLLYYPFSEEDTDSYIAVFVIRALLSIAIKSIKGGPDVFEDKIISFDEVVAHNFNHVWKALSLEHRRSLKEKIREVIKRLLAKEDVKEALGIIQQRQGYKITGSLDQFKKAAEDLIAELQSQVSLSKWT
jgi:hypothetical protein